MRSEFDTAEKDLNAAIAHTRTYNIFSTFAARISLHHAHLAHALMQTSRALDCYHVAAQLAESGSFVQLSAKAGELVLRLSLQNAKENVEKLVPEANDTVDTKEALRFAKACRSMGGSLVAIGRIIEALLSPEILRAK